jgi:hypothetical protein
MTRRLSRHDETAPTLFPFLAVLICTMGAIIVLLVLVVKRADVQAHREREIKQEKMGEHQLAAKDKLAVIENRVELMSGLRPDLKNRLGTHRTLAGHLVDHITRLQQELDLKKNELESLSNSKAKANQPESEAKIAELRTKVTKAKENLAAQKKELVGRKKSYAIVPRSGPGNGTFRRPIYIECTENGVTLQPYKITLTAADFPTPLGSGNPLDVALLLIRDYWNQIDPDQKNGQPYPLFIVRPSGPKSFAAARKAMKSWIDEFGYELVTSEVKLQFPTADKQFQQRLITAIEQAKRTQMLRLATANRNQALQSIRRLEGAPNFSSSSAGLSNASGRGKVSGGYRASPITGGFVQDPEYARPSNTQFTSQTSDKASAIPAGSSQSGLPKIITLSKKKSGQEKNHRSLTDLRTFDDQHSTPEESTASSISNLPPFRKSGFQKTSAASKQATGDGSGKKTNTKDSAGGLTKAALRPPVNSQTPNNSSFNPGTTNQVPPTSSDQNNPSSGGNPSADQKAGTNSSNPSGSPAKQSLAKTRGVNWALPSKATNAIQVRKPIKVLVGEKGVQIIELGKGIKEIPFRGETATALPMLVEQVWKHIDAWGIAGVNSYWKPDLHMYVSPGADKRFEDLKTLLSGSGLDVRRIQ